MVQKFIAFIMLSMLASLVWAQPSVNNKSLQIEGNAEFLNDHIIADRDENYDINGNLSAGILIVSDVQGLTFRSSFGILRVVQTEAGSMIYVSPNERELTVFQSEDKSLDINLSDAGIELEGGEVWKIRIVESEGTKKEGRIILTDEIRLLENEIISNREDNRSRAGILAAGIKIYSEMDEFYIEPTDQLWKIQDGPDFKLLYVDPDIAQLVFSSPGRELLTIDLSEFILESGKIYSGRIE